MEFTPTPEQQAVIDAAQTGANLVVQAGAGTGKTATLQMVAEARPRSSIYVAYNKAIATEAATKFPSLVKCKTSHSIAFGAVGRQFAHRLNSARRPSWELAKDLGLGWLKLGRDIRVSPHHQARIAGDAVRRFCYSADDELGARHVPFQNGITGRNHNDLVSRILPLARDWWNDVNSVDGTMPFEHDHYLKIWALGEPDLFVDIVFLDEAQDSNPVLAKVIAAQDAQQIVVGDSCQPTGTLVTVVKEPGKGGKPTVTQEVPIEQLKVGDLVVSYNVAHRYLHRNGSRVAGISARPFQGYLVRVEDAEGRISRYTPDHHCVARFGDNIAEKFVVYLMQKGDNFRVGVTSGRMISGRNKRIGLIQRASAEKADAMWLVDVYNTKAEALTAEALIAWTYGVPDVMFRSERHGMGQEGIEKFWAKMGGNRSQASHLLFCYGRDIDFPIWKRGESLQTRRPFVTRACNLINGMEVLPLTDEIMSDGHAVTRKSWLPIAVDRGEYYDGDVWSMTVEGDHTYVGDGIVTHNCQQMYAWRGAVDALSGWKDSQELFLKQSWRFGQVIADEANKWLNQLATPLELIGNPGLDSVLGELETPDAVLCRTNAGAMGAVLGGLEAGQNVALVGGGQQLERLAKACADLREKGKTSHPELFAFDSWDEVARFAKEEASGRDMLPLVNLIEAHGTQPLIEAIQKLVSEDNADVVVSTVHKAKGREWDSVKVAADFFEPRSVEGEEPTVSEPEAMVGYVAVTRAKQVLDRSNLAWIDDFVDLPEQPEEGGTDEIIEDLT